MKFVRKDKSLLMRLIGFFSPDFMKYFWTTIGSTIYYPTTVDDPRSEEYDMIIKHEQTHIRQCSVYGKYWFLFLYLFVPVPFFFAYFRWKFEREAYLVELRSSFISSELVANCLHDNYGRPWPKKWMIKWFDENRVIDNKYL